MPIPLDLPAPPPASTLLTSHKAKPPIIQSPQLALRSEGAQERAFYSASFQPLPPPFLYTRTTPHPVSFLKHHTTFLSALSLTHRTTPVRILSTAYRTTPLHASFFTHHTTPFPAPFLALHIFHL
ncbi:hypothetical protein Pcinc_036166 [Petrolisthes cinctipes]|uniref:Uncharacterized protein n=1 Tax=Petrolisthes cinctipes TaxID=88211 RepID=A0AAE1BV92_PETCI|nr:hypothetical protein Pcinc_036166 [Petrolisthes cinctipes]